MSAKKIILFISMVAGLLVAGSAISQNIKLNPIKPGVKSSAQITDEQQAILAVRKAKASVVNIFGENTLLSVNGVPTSLEPIAGTGIIIGSDGYIVTNRHVVAKENVEYRVVLPSGAEYAAKVLGKDQNYDVALLKIEEKNLTAAALGNSSDLETGQTVFAIGNSLGIYQNTVSRGVVSGIGRAVNVGDQDNPLPRYLNLIQTDAAISPGNSGGPLVNMAGEVVGMNTLIETAGYSLGFAVPANTLKSAVEELKAFGKVSKPFLGMAYETINKSVKILRQLKHDQGAFVIEVLANSPAERAGLLPGDVIAEVNRVKLTGQNELDITVVKYKAGDTILLTFFRGEEKIETPVLLGEFK